MILYIKSFMMSSKHLHMFNPDNVLYNCHKPYLKQFTLCSVKLGINIFCKESLLFNLITTLS
jgi:hypothetical protein